MNFRRILGVSLAAPAAALVCFSLHALAQTQTPPPAQSQPPGNAAPAQIAPVASDKTFSTDVNVVNVFATVHDKKGQLVKELTQDDFTIEEDGRPQSIKYFARESNLPLTLGLLVDTSGSMMRLIETERLASGKFFDQVLREDKDVAFVIHFDAEVELLQDVTSQRKLLYAALDQLSSSSNPHMQRRDPNDPNGGYGGGNSRNGGYGPRHAGTTLYDSILLASNEIMKKQTGRKAIVLLTDGEDRGSKVTLTDAISAAQRSNTLVYAIRFADENSGFQNALGGFGGRGMGRRGGGRYPQESHEDGKKVLQRIAKETGGGYFEGSKSKSLDDVYRQIQDELRSQYSLGYTPDKDSGPGYRVVRVLTRDSKQIVQARDGYYAEK